MSRSDRTEIEEAHRQITGRRLATAPVLEGRGRRNYTAPPGVLNRRREDPDNFRDLSNSIRHLTYHMCPFSHSSEAWKWNLDQLKSRWSLFNGLKVLGINFDDKTVDPDDLLGYCSSIGLEWDHTVIKPNSRAVGEVMTWLPSLEFLSPDTSSENEVVFSAHAKGVKYETMPALIKDWAEVMYVANLDNWDRVRDSLEWFVSTGAFRCRGVRSKKWCRYGWYYSGAFWWWRLSDVGRRNWRYVGEIYPGREVWIGNTVDKTESDCLFLDNCRSPYIPEYWSRVIRPRWKEFLQEVKIDAPTSA